MMHQVVIGALGSAQGIVSQGLVSQAADGDSPTEEIEDGARSMVDTALDALPRLGVAIAVIAVGWVAARGIRWLLHRYWSRNNGPSFAEVMSKLVSWVVLGIVVLAAATITFPSVKPVDLLAGLGFFSIAIGFAFQDILENTLSGMLLLLRAPFKTGDQVEVEGAEGTVEAITIRETRITTYDGRLIYIPNADVYKNAIVVRTENELRRDAFMVGVAYETNLAEAADRILEAVAAIDGVANDPAPEALVNEFGTSTIDIEVRYWTDPRQRNVRHMRSAAMRAVKTALDDNGIELPCPIVVLQSADSFSAAVNGERATSPAGALLG